MAYSTINNHKYGNCNCGCGGIDVAGRKVGKTFHCLDSYSRMKSEEQLDRAKKRNALRNTGSKLRALVGKGENDLIQSRNNLISQLDFLVSRYVRISACDSSGYLDCYTCNDRVFWKDAQCSHFIKRGANMVLRFDIRFNTRPACKSCNEYKDGNLEEYAKNLELEQKGVVEMLQERGRQVEKYDLHELKQMAIDMQAKVNLVSQRLKNIGS